MPQLIEHIDAIARAKQRAVLFVTFHKNLEDRVNWETLPIRAQIIAWLDANGMAWQCCGEVARTDCMTSYRGQIYIDLPFDERDPTYQKLRDYLEKADGSMVFDDALFCYTTLDAALKNAHHDVPGFWENWSEND